MTIYPVLSICIFLLLYCFSSFLSSLNNLNSSGQILIILFNILIYLLSVRILIKKRVIFFAIFGVCIISGVLFLLHFAFPQVFSFLQPSAFQFIIPIGQGHNHLGDLVGLGLIAILISPVSFPYQPVIALFYLLLLITSFSKSALFAVVITVFIIALVKKSKFITIFIVISVISMLTVVIYTKEFSSNKVVSLIQKNIEHYTSIKPKPLLSSRNVYVSQVANSWVSSSLEHSFFGFGPGNFIYASNKTGLPWETSSDTHNVFLTIFIESGILTLFWFVLFLIFTIYIGIKTNNPLVFLVIYLMANFQTDYSYRIPLFLITFFVLSGQIVAPSVRKIVQPLKNILLTFILIFALFSIYYLYLSTYYTTLIKSIDNLTLTRNVPSFRKAAKKLEAITPYDDVLILKLALSYEYLYDYSESVRLLEKLAIYSPHTYLRQLPHQLDLQKKLNIDTSTYLKNKRAEFNTFPYAPVEKRRLHFIYEEYIQ